MKTNIESYQNLTKKEKLENRIMDIESKLCALEHRLEFNEISKREYNFNTTPLKNELNRINIDIINIDMKAS